MAQNLSQGLISSGHHVSVLQLKEGESICKMPEGCIVSYPGNSIRQPPFRKSEFSAGESPSISPLEVSRQLYRQALWKQITSGYPIYAVHKKRVMYAARVASWLMQQKQEENSVDVTISFMPKSNIANINGSIMASHKGPVIFTEHEDPNRHDFLMKRAMRFFYPQADAVIGVSKGVTGALGRMFLQHTDDKRMFTIYNPVYSQYIDHIAKQEPDHPWLKNKDCPVILNVARMHRQKDHATLIKAFAILRSKRKVRLIIMGGGIEKLRRRYNRLAVALGIQEDVSINHWSPNPYSAMHNADLFVLSSKWEGLANVIIESLACGCNVVSTDCNYGPKEILNNEEYGKLVPIVDHKSLAKAMEEQLDSPIDKDLLRSRAQEFSIEKSTQDYLSIINRTLSECGKNSRAR